MMSLGSEAHWDKSVDMSAIPTRIPSITSAKMLIDKVNAKILNITYSDDGLSFPSNYSSGLTVKPMVQFSKIKVYNKKDQVWELEFDIEGVEAQGIFLKYNLV